MGFLDNSGDIILDAVLTDTGRMRLSKGDGSFKIAKFALADDEIDYGLYQNSNHSKGAHASGSAYYDLQILQTPVLEALTNNTSTMKSKLISIARTNLLYLPVLKVNEVFNNSFKKHSDGVFMIAVDSDTEKEIATVGGTTVDGILMGETLSAGTTIRVDQGLDTAEIAPTFTIDADLVETQYILEIDNRFGSITDTTGNRALVSFIDDDNVASYYLSLGTDPGYVSTNDRTQDDGKETISGPRGTLLQFKIASSLELNTSTYLFNLLGQTGQSMTGDSGTVTVDIIDTTVRVTGATTGYRIDIPIRFVKKQ